MKRRDFVSAGLGGIAAAAAGCSGARMQKVPIKGRFSDFSFDITKKKPSGTMPSGELGTTGIKVSKFGFGAHMHKDLVPYEKERCQMIRDAYDLGVNIFDVYDHWGVTQFEPMSRHLEPINKDVIISLNMILLNNRTCEQEFDRALKIFKRDTIDMYRLNANANTTESPVWHLWEKMFRYKEQGKIRAVGMSIHEPKEIEIVLNTYPIDYVIFPFNFYHNLLHNGKFAGDYKPLVKRLREKGIGIVVMKPLGTDWFVTPLIEVGKTIDESGEISIPQAMLRYVINSDVKPDITLGGMFNLDHVYEDVPAFYNTKMTSEEKKLLKKLRETAVISSQAWLPEYYRFLDKWRDRYNISDLETA